MEDGRSPKLSHVLFGKLEIFWHKNEHMLSGSFNDVDPPFLINKPVRNFIQFVKLQHFILGSTKDLCFHSFVG